ncbi:hypothetical protein E4T85_21700 [Bacillus stratosphericus]|nr:hypothetical protein E4T85_21700 [Bacillus stratosphericus]
MKKSALFSAFGIGLLSINLAFATPAEAVNQVRTNATQVLDILKEANGSNDAAVRRKAEDLGSMKIEDFIAVLQQELAQTSA